MKAVIVDDDPVCRTTLGRLLEMLGWQVVRVGDGPAGLDEMRLGGTGLLVTDVQMPGMDGLALADAARALVPDLPIVFVSGRARDVCYDRSRFLAKPVTRAALEEALAYLVSTSSLTREFAMPGAKPLTRTPS